MPGLVTKVGDVFAIPKSARFGSLDDLIRESEIDALLICSGGSHVRAVVAGLDHGLAVLCEKPLAFTQGEIDAVRRAIPPGSPRLMVGYMKQYDPAVTRAAELLRDIDDVRSIDVTVLHPTGYSQLEFAHILSGGAPDATTAATLQREDDALRQAAIGGVDDDTWRLFSGSLMSSLTHDMSVLRVLSGSPRSVEYVDVWRRASSRQQHETGRDMAALGSWPPSIRVVGQLPDSARYFMDWHYLHDFPAYRETVRIVHGSGALELSFPSPYLLHAPTVLTIYSPNGNAEERTEFRSTAEAFELELKAFADMVVNGTAPLTGIDGAEEDLHTSQTIIAEYARRENMAVGGEIGALL